VVFVSAVFSGSPSRSANSLIARESLSCVKAKPQMARNLAAACQCFAERRLKIGQRWGNVIYFGTNGAVTEPMALATGLCGASFSRKRPDASAFGSKRSPPK